MSTQLSICNRALIKLGAEPVFSLSIISKETNLLNAVYDELRADLLSSHPWNFAIGRTELSLLASTPDAKWSHEYQLPTDYLRILSAGLNTGSIPYAVEEGKLRCNSSSINVKYIKNITTAGTFSKPFTESLAWHIADELCYVMVQDKGVRDRIRKDAENYLIDARNRDAQEGTPENFFPDTWLDSRRQLADDYWD